MQGQGITKPLGEQVTGHSDPVFKAGHMGTVDGALFRHGQGQKAHLVHMPAVIDDADAAASDNLRIGQIGMQAGEHFTHLTAGMDTGMDAQHHGCSTVDVLFRQEFFKLLECCKQMVVSFHCHFPHHTVSLYISMIFCRW